MTTIRSADDNESYSALHPNLPLPSESHIGAFQIFHPAYLSSEAIIRLPILDVVHDSNPPRFGFHHGTALMICFIITGNRAGFLSSSLISLDDQRALIELPETTPEFDSILLEKKYYYYIYSTRPDEKYKVLCRPQEWCFPTRTNLRDFHWERWEAVFGQSRDEPPPGDVVTSNISARVRARDKACRLTGVSEICGCQSAHIIQPCEQDWFIRNRMDTYAKSSLQGADPTTRPSNMCLLRSDIYWMFDQDYFVFVPKQGHLTVHFVNDVPLQACRAFHNGSLDSPTDFAGEYFLSRLAFTVIPLTRRFNLLHGETLDDQKRKRAHGPSNDGGRSKRPKPRRSDTNDSSDPTATRASTPYLPDTAPNHDTVDEVRELEEDLELAALRLPHIFNPDLVRANPKLACSDTYHAHLVDTLAWYPGHRRMERMKEAYMRDNPQVRASSSRSNGEEGCEMDA